MTSPTDRQRLEDRQQHMRHAALRASIHSALTGHTALRELLQRCCQACMQHLPLAWVRLWTRDATQEALELRASDGRTASRHRSSPGHFPLTDRKIRRLVQDSQPYLTNEVQTSPGLSSKDKQWLQREGGAALAVYPLLLDEQVVGVLALLSREPLDEETFDALAWIAAALAQRIGRTWAQEQLEEAARLSEQARMLAVLQERQRLARELHDTVSQLLYGMSMSAHSAREALKGDDANEAMVEVERIIQYAAVGMAELRTLLVELRPEALESEGLVTALERHVLVLRTAYRLTVETDLGEEPVTAAEIKLALYRIIQEALHNIVKHAQASHVTLRLTHNEQEIMLEIHDDGRGFNPEQTFAGHFGLQSMQERAAQLHGTLTVISAPGRGTSVSAHIPHPGRGI
jgi:signal transduction histidine kinase